MSVSVNQIETLVSYMESHSLFARSQIMSLGPSGHDKYKSMWQNLAMKLNLIGPAQKDIDGWTRQWKTLKANAKQKKAKYLFGMRATGNNKVIPLSDFDERITAIFGDFGSGYSIIPELGFVDRTTDDVSQNGLDLYAAFKYYQESQNILMTNYKESNVLINRMLKLIKLTYTRQNMASMQRLNKTQLKLLLTYMSKNYEVATSPLTDDSYDSHWKEYSTFLNSISTEQHSSEWWKKAWDDQKKLVIKKKNLFLDNKGLLSDIDKQILEAIGEQVAVEKQRENLGPSSFKRPCLASDASAMGAVKEQTEVVSDFGKNLVQAIQDQTNVFRKGFEDLNKNIEKLIEILVPIYVDELETHEESDDGQEQE